MSSPSSSLITYLGAGAIGSRPATPNLGTGLFGAWWDTGAKALSIYDLVNNAWNTAGGGGGGGYSYTGPTVVQSANNVTGNASVTLGAGPTNGNLLVCMTFNTPFPSPGSGWTQLAQNGSGTDYGTILYKVAGVAESTTQSPISANETPGCMVVWEVTGQNATWQVASSLEAEQASATYAFSVPIGPLHTNVLFLGAIGLVSSTGNFTNLYGVIQDQAVKTGSSRQIVAGHASLDKFPLAQIAANISAASSYKALGLLITA